MAVHNIEQVNLISQTETSEKSLMELNQKEKMTRKLLFLNQWAWPYKILLWLI